MILVTGASGNVGRMLVSELTARGAAFTAAFRSAAQADDARKSGVRAVVLDYAQPDTLEAAMRGVEKVFLLSPPSPNLAELETNVVRTAREMDVRHIVKLSVWRAEDEYTFARGHHLIELLLRSSGLAYTLLRPNGFMQNMLGNAATIKAQGAFYMPASDAKVSEIDVRDIASVAANALTQDGHEGMTYTLSGPEAISNADKAQRMSDVLHKTIAYVPMPDEQWLSTIQGYGVPQWLAEALLNLMNVYRTGVAAEVTPWVETVTGRAPIPFRQFAADYAEAFA